MARIYCLERADGGPHEACLGMWPIAVTVTGHVEVAGHRAEPRPTRCNGVREHIGHWEIGRERQATEAARPAPRPRRPARSDGEGGVENGSRWHRSPSTIAV